MHRAFMITASILTNHRNYQLVIQLVKMVGHGLEVGCRNFKRKSSVLQNCKSTFCSAQNTSHPSVESQGSRINIYAVIIHSKVSNVHKHLSKPSRHILSPRCNVEWHRCKQKHFDMRRHRFYADSKALFDRASVSFQCFSHHEAFE